MERAMEKNPAPAFRRARAAGLQLRPSTPADGELIFRIYASTRAEELAPVPWSAEQKEAFLRSQLHAQMTHYTRHYTQAAFDIVELDTADGAQPCGRLYVDRRPHELGIIDIALLPACRRCGFGTALLQDLLDEALDSGSEAVIYVESMNPARRLYERLGFEYAGEQGIYQEMRWHAAAATAEIVTPDRLRPGLI
jgi:ribosomal protein S18 acetylase RimI-like enzyme